MRTPTLIFSVLALSRVVLPCDCGGPSLAFPTPAADISTNFGVGVDSTSAGAKQIKSLTGATYTTGKSSSASLTETAQGELVLKWSMVYDSADGDYGTAVSLLLPMTPAWDIKDLSAYQEIDYDIRSEGSAAVTAHMQIGSDAYGDSAKAAGAALAQPKWIATTTTYQTVKVRTDDLNLNDWYTGADAATTGWFDAAYTYNIGKAVKYLSFQPQVGWSDSATIKSGAKGTLYIRNVKVIGLECYCPTYGVGCAGEGVTIEDFAPSKKVLGQNYLGGSWFAYSDTSSDPSKVNDSAVGSSTVLLPAGQTTWAPDAASSTAILTATLEKNVPASSYLYHRYAGWAGIGTEILDPTTGGTSYDLSATPNGGSLTAISFDLYAGSALGAHTIDTSLVRRIIFKTSKASVDDAEAFYVDIPVGMATSTTANNFCVDLAQIHQPGWYVKDHLGGVAVPFSPKDLSKLAWEVKIEDQSDPTKHTSANNTIAVGNLRFYGITAADLDNTGIKSRSGTVDGLKVSYGSVLVLSYNVAGPSARIEVRHLDGARVASFQEAALAQNLSLPVALSRGTYVVTVQGNKVRQVATLSVAR